MVSVSIIIPTRNRASRLPLCLEAIFPQLTKGDEIVVVDNASRDNTKKYLHSLHSFKQLRYAYEPNVGPSYARNHGYRLSQNSTVAFLDDDCVAADNWLDTIKATVQSGSALRSIYVGRILHVFPSLGLLESLFLLRHQLEWQTIQSDPGWRQYRYIHFLHAGNFFASRDVLSQVHPLFDAYNFPFLGEERDLAYRLQLHNIPIQYVPAVSVVHHKTKIKLASWVRFTLLLGATQGKLRKRYCVGRKVRMLFYNQRKRRQSIYGLIYKKLKSNYMTLCAAIGIMLVRDILFAGASWLTFTEYKKSKHT